MGRIVDRGEAALDRLLRSWRRDVDTDEGADEGADERLTAEAAVIFRLALRVALVAVVLQTVGHLVDALAFDLSIDRLDADKDVSVWGWAGPVSELMAGLGVALLALVVPRHSRVLGWLSVGVVYLSLDDTIQVHERVANRISEVLLRISPSWDVSARLLWPITYLPLLALMFLVLWQLSGTFVRPCRRALRVSLLLLGLAILLELSALLVVHGLSGRPHYPYEFEVAAEEACELGGWLVIAGATLASGVDLLVRRARRSAARDRGDGPVPDAPRTAPLGPLTR